ncbi:tyrosinase family oxidase copper chaperone [Streptomyces sp. NPDC044984]|uniref:tyrosinase family oxidase copper chaperone n=1 Tax=Streptomyces sp. NPDC044984 TaxID=3154335 RepID=UPI00340836EF
MVVNTGGTPVDITDGTPEAARPGPVGGTRREVVRGLRACALTVTLAPLLAASRSPYLRPAREDGVPDGAAFDRIHRGRRIRGTWFPARDAAEDGRWHVTVDDRPLHLMRRADGTWLSEVDHYCSYRTPLEAARAAVDALPPGQGLRAGSDDGTAHSPGGGRHGVRA